MTKHYDEFGLTIQGQVNQNIMNLYEKALHHCQKGMEAMDANDLRVRNLHLIPLSTFISELFVELKKYADEDSQENLNNILSSVYSLISKAIIHHDIKVIKELLGHLNNIKLTYQNEMKESFNVRSDLKTKQSDHQES